MAASSSSSTTQMDSTKLRRDSSTDEYESWKEAMLRILESRNLVGLIDGRLPLPPEPNSQAHKDWKQIDRSLKDWIIERLHDEFLPIVVGRKTSRDVWLQLEKMFTQSTPPPTSSPHQAGFKRMPLALYKAALRGDWDTTKAILEQDPDLAEARMAPNSDTPLHVAVRTGQAIPYLQNLLNYVTDDSLALKNDSSGNTALNVAALQGNLAAARILVERRRDLLYVPDKWGVFPIVKAAMSVHRPTIDFFMSETKDDEIEGTNPYADDYGVLLLNTLISSHFFDIALGLIDKYPNLAKRKHASGHSALRTIALKDTAFASGAHFSFWERLFYNSIQLEMELEQVAADIENPSCCTIISRGFGRWRRVGWNFHTALYHVIRLLVPHTEWIHDQKMKHGQALKLVLCLCKHMESLSVEEATPIFADGILKAAEFGIHEVVEAIIDTFPIAVYCSEGSTKRFFFHMAVENRCEKVFNLIYQMSDSKEQFSTVKDYSGETLLHRVARLAPPHKLNLVSGAALQMQRELQWFKEVEKFVKPYDREQPNNDGRTPRMIFTEEHSNLKAEGEKWMKDTANSCSIAAALIATVVFAAAITIPGGNADTGYPLFDKSIAFIIFAVSDAISLFTSSTSLLMFLSILTSRYAEDDFLYALPKRLCVGLFTLFLSILFMMAAFSCAIYLVFGRTSGWVLIPVAGLACMPVASFVLLQFPLLVDVVSSTYGRGIFGKQSDRPFF